MSMNKDETSESQIMSAGTIIVLMGDDIIVFSVRWLCGLSN